MKKKILLVASIFAMASTSFAEWLLTFASGTFFYDGGTMIQDTTNFALIVDMNNKGFDGLILQDGDSFSRGSFINSQNDYKTLAAGSLMDADGEGYYLAYSNSSWRFTNADFGFQGGEKIALVAWNTKDFTLIKGDMYTIVSPSLTGMEVDPWSIALTDTGKYVWEIYCESISEGDPSEVFRPDSFFTLSRAVGGIIPEPSTYAAIFGAAALAFALIRRRK